MSNIDFIYVTQIKSYKVLNAKDSCIEWQKLARKYNDVDIDGNL